MTTRYSIMGTTNDVTECHCCGRADLKRTVVLGVLDADGSVMGLTYFGVDCAARTTGFGAATIVSRAEGKKTARAVAWNGWTLGRFGDLRHPSGLSVHRTDSDVAARAFAALTAMARGELVVFA